MTGPEDPIATSVVAAETNMPAKHHSGSVAEYNPTSVPETNGSAIAQDEANGLEGSRDGGRDEERPQKRARLDGCDEGVESNHVERRKGTAPVKAEYLVDMSNSDARDPAVNDDDAEAAGRADARDLPGGDRKERKGGKRQRNRGQNTHRDFGASRDERGLCGTRALYSEFSPRTCKFGEKCKFEHDLRKYLNQWKRENLITFGGKCPILEMRGRCHSGWKCRFVGSHMTERETSDGRKELCLVGDRARSASQEPSEDDNNDPTILNNAPTEVKISLARKKFETRKADQYIKYLDEVVKDYLDHEQANRNRHLDAAEDGNKHDLRAEYKEPPFLPSEKRRLYFGPETPVLAPLTTQGNLPFRRLCVDLGAQLTYSEMAIGTSLVQGQKSEWALMRAHKSESLPPRFNAGSNHVVEGYENGKDLKFGAQIAANKPYMALKATEILAKVCPSLRVIDLNCGCPIDLVFKQGAGSALLDSPGKLDKILQGMSAVSGEIPITTKIRMGTKDGKPNALKLVDRWVYGGTGVAAITLHGRSRQQRYTRSADWEYIASCAALINQHRQKGDELADTIQEVDPRHKSANGKAYFIGNGDCYSHVDYYDHLSNAKVDSVMVARGALIKPWIFEEIEKGQYLDKSASERLALVEKYARYGLDLWGSDEMGIGFTRRFLLEWLSFAHRYIPIGLLEHLPPSIQDRPPAWRGRNELETLLGSDNYKDWIKISEMFLGPANKDFHFEPKHRSNSYAIEAEG